MGKLVTSGAMMMCSFGMAPSTLNVLPTSKVVGGAAAASIMDNKPFVNIPPFGMCMSLANPQVAAATAAAMGVLTPQPCIPVIPAPWAPGSPTTLIGGMPALNQTSKCMCAWAGIIQITFPGQVTIDVP
ncbi:MAG: DUF4280 domain-containing protein [candidate division Zixibacteria bacterium]|nr:DUF4280 domain-containing protein [candidate division Zixibacteria bacterium]